MVSIILPVFRNSILLEYCLDHLTRNLPSGTELIVVDDASGQETLDVINKFKNIRLLQHASNRGNTAAYNTGARAAKGEVLIFIDSDILLDIHTLKNLEEVVLSNPSAGVVGSLLLFPQNYTIQHAGVAFDRWVLSHVYTGRNPNEIVLSDLEERQAVTAALCACRKATYELVCGFDETYRDGLEDIDFCLKCQEQGLVNLLATSIRAMHIESATRGPFKQVRRTFNYAIFFSRWHDRYRPDLCDYLKKGVGMISLPWEDLSAVTLTALNFCTTPNWPDLVAVIADQSLHFSGVHDLSGFISLDESIDLYRSIPIAFQKIPSPLLLVVDHFSQLAKNRHWFDQRPAVDLIIDRHANAVMPRIFT